MDRYFYSVEMDGDRKVVHLLGNIYLNDADETKTCYRLAEWTGLFITPEKILKLFKEFRFYDYIDEKVAYLDDLTESEMIITCQTYFNETSGRMLYITEVNKDTPCGDYWF